MKTPKGLINIRSSSIAGFQACQRFFAFNRDPNAAFQAHPDLAENQTVFPKFKAAMGTAFHAAVEKGVHDAENIKKLVEEAVGGEDALPNFYDERYTEKAHMEKVVGDMIEVFVKSPLAKEWTEDREASEYEMELTSTELPGIFWTGHVDCINRQRVIDLKTSVYVTADNLHIEQLTSYRLLAQHNGREAGPVADVVKVSKPGTPKWRTPPKVARYSMDTRVHEQRVVTLVKKAADLVSRRDSWKGDFTRIPCNPMAKTCSYCGLKNTSACPETKYQAHE